MKLFKPLYIFHFSAIFAKIYGVYGMESGNIFKKFRLKYLTKIDFYFLKLLNIILYIYYISSIINY